MKFMTATLVFLSALILGYALAEYKRPADHVYIVRGSRGTLQPNTKNQTLTLTFNHTPKSIGSLSRNKPNAKGANGKSNALVQHIPLKKFLQQWKVIKSTNRKGLMVAFRHQDALYPLYGTLQDITYEEKEDTLSLVVASPQQEGNPNPLARHTEVVWNVDFNIFQMH